MSCMVQISTKLRDLDTVKQAADALGYAAREGVTEVAGYGSQRQQALLVLAVGGSYDVGVARAEDGTLSLVCDWEMARIDERAFSGRLAQEYSAIQVRERARAAGYVIARETREANGQIKLLLRRFE